MATDSTRHGPRPGHPTTPGTFTFTVHLAAFVETVPEQVPNMTYSITVLR